MAAATQSFPQILDHSDARIVCAVRLSSMTSDQIEQVNFAVDTRIPIAVPKDVRMRIITSPTARCGLFLDLVGFTMSTAAGNNPITLTQLTALSGQTPNNPPFGNYTLTVPCRVYVESGGDITGAVVDIIAEWSMYSSGQLLNAAGNATLGNVNPPQLP